jgi:hypothetical protein
MRVYTALYGKLAQNKKKKKQSKVSSDRESNLGFKHHKQASRYRHDTNFFLAIVDSQPWYPSAILIFSKATIVVKG